MKLTGFDINPAYKITMLGEGGNQWDLIIPTGTVIARNTILIGSRASGGATFIADSTCVDGGNNTGWIFLNEPLSPVVTTDSLVNISTTTAIANATIVSTTGETITRRGFCYKEGENESPTLDDYVVYEDGIFEAGSFSMELTGLNSAFKYSVRAFISTYIDEGGGE